MYINILQYIFYFSSVTLLYFLLPSRFRWILLLAASYLLYFAWNTFYAFILLFVTLVSYVFARYSILVGKKYKKYCVLVAVTLIVTTLFIFKYLGFATISLNSFLRILQLDFRFSYRDFILPVGLSFYSLKAISYMVDVYKKKMPAEKHFGYYALYIAFFPQVVAGPIDRASDLIPQFKKKHTFDYDRIKQGSITVVFGFFKKLVIADRIAPIVATVFSAPHQFTGTSLLLASLLFTIQIYADFSGYSDIAIGSARILGIRSGPNFNFPYAATSISDFWRRWHISFSSWLKDYVYIPLGGNRVGPWRKSFNILITFAVSGLWHGASITFIFWGLMHGFFMIIPMYTRTFYDKMTKNLSIRPFITKFFSITFTFILVTIAWIFFKANTLSDAVYIITHIPRTSTVFIKSILTWKTELLLQVIRPEGFAVSDKDLHFTLILLAVFGILQLLFYRSQKKPLSTPVRWSMYYVMVLLIVFVFICYGGNGRQFIYATF